MVHHLLPEGENIPDVIKPKKDERPPQPRKQLSEGCVRVRPLRKGMVEARRGRGHGDGRGISHSLFSETSRM